MREAALDLGRPVRLTAQVLLVAAVDRAVVPGRVYVLVPASGTSPDVSEPSSAGAPPAKVPILEQVAVGLFLARPRNMPAVEVRVAAAVRVSAMTQAANCTGLGVQSMRWVGALVAFVVAGLCREPAFFVVPTGAVVAAEVVLPVGHSVAASAPGVSGPGRSEPVAMVLVLIG